MTAVLKIRVTKVTAEAGIRRVVSVSIPARRGPPGKMGKDGEPGPPGALENMSEVIINGGFF